MNLISKLFGPLERTLNKLGVCSTVGLMAGGITGFILFCHYLNYPATVFTAPELLRIAAMLWLFCFLIILFILIIFCRFTFGSVFIQTLINTLFSSFATTYFVHLTDLWLWAFFIGILIGLIIGRLLCFICNTLKRK